MHIDLKIVKKRKFLSIDYNSGSQPFLTHKALIKRNFYGKPLKPTVPYVLQVSVV